MAKRPTIPSVATASTAKPSLVMKHLSASGNVCRQRSDREGRRAGGSTKSSSVLRSRRWFAPAGVRRSSTFAAVLLQARHDLDEVAGAVAVVELVHQDAVPGVAAGAGRARQAEDIGAVGQA